jgi:UPF0755 protein
LTRGKRSQPSPQRTEQERERDRVEREQRRAERSGRHGTVPAAAVPLPIEEPQEVPLPPPPPPPVDGPERYESPAVEEQLVQPEPEPEPDPDALAPNSGVDELEAPSEPAVAPSEPAVAPSEPAVAPSAPASTSVPTPDQLAQEQPALEDPAPAGAAPSAPQQPAPEGGSPVAGREASPSGSRLPPAPVQAGASARRTSAIRAAAPAARSRRRRGRLPLTRALALLALAAVVAAVVLLVKSLAGSGSGKKTPVGAVVKVVIPEGATRLQIAHIAAADGLKGSYRGASKQSSLVNPTHFGAPAGTHDLEGFLYPATYDMLPGASVARLVHEQLVAFRENFGSSETARARSLHVTPYQLLTIASMVEREAKVPGDRAKIAAVIYNRLKKGVPLGIDATIYYALERQKGIASYTKELTEAQLQLNSPYNTRTRTGLPPTPIANPGLASIEAATKPAHVAYLYYVLAADGCGEHTFSTSLAKFEADAAAYRAAVKKNGGAPPTCKK